MRASALYSELAAKIASVLSRVWTDLDSTDALTSISTPKMAYVLAYRYTVVIDIGVDLEVVETSLEEKHIGYVYDCPIR